MRKLLYSGLANDVAMRALETDDGGSLVGDQVDPTRFRLYQKGSLGADDIPQQPQPFPWLVLSENPSTVESKLGQHRYFQVYCYDKDGLGYVQIERILFLVRDTALGLVGQQSSSGAWCMGAEWLGLSADSRDPDYEANMKFISIKLTTSQ